MLEMEASLLERHFKRRKGYFKRIQNSIEYYLSDANLRNDLYMKNILQESNEIDPTVFLTFNRICELGADVQDILKAVSPSSILEITVDKKIRRRFPVVEKTKEDIDWCSIYVENIPLDATPDDLIKVFRAFGKIAKVTIPKHRFGTKIAGFAFVEFENFHSRRSALQAFQTYGAIINFNNGTLQSSISDYDFEDDLNCEKVRELQVEHVKMENTIEIPLSVIAEEECLNKRRKNRKKKKRGKLKFMGVKIMSKTAWNLLRGRYMNLQAINRRRLKIHLAKFKKLPHQHSRMKCLIPGSVVTVTLPDRTVESDIIALKAEIKAMENVEYVDVELGQTICYIRMVSADAATTLAGSQDVLPGCQLAVLPTHKEAEYFAKIEEDRRRKFSCPNPARKKISGRKRILDRAERQLGFKMRVHTEESLHI